MVKREGREAHGEKPAGQENKNPGLLRGMVWRGSGVLRDLRVLTLAQAVVAGVARRARLIIAWSVSVGLAPLLSQ